MTDAGPSAEAPVRATLRHQSRNRARLKLVDAPDATQLEALAHHLAEFTGLERVLIRPHTGSIILESHAPMDEVLEAIAASGLLQISAGAQHPPVAQVVQLGMVLMDQSVQKRTDGALDLRSTLALLLVFAAIVQLTRGRFVGPAATLMMSALSLMEMPKRR